MARFTYLSGPDAPGRKKDKADRKKKGRKAAPAPDGRRKEDRPDRPEAVYLRRETVRAVWRELKKDGGESVSELVEDLLLHWLRERPTGH